MTTQYRESVRNSRLDQIEVVSGSVCALRIYTGSQPANCTSANSGTLLGTITLPSDWLAAASGGTKSKAGTWSTTASGGSASTPGHYRIYSSQSTLDGTTCTMQGSCGIGSGDINFDGTITNGQTITITTFTITEGNP